MISEHFILKCSLLYIKIYCIKSVLQNKVPYNFFIYMFLKEVSYAHQGCIYLITKNSNICEILLQIKITVF